LNKTFVLALALIIANCEVYSQANFFECAKNPQGCSSSGDSAAAPVDANSKPKIKVDNKAEIKSLTVSQQPSNEADSNQSGIKSNSNIASTTLPGKNVKESCGDILEKIAEIGVGRRRLLERE